MRRILTTGALLAAITGASLALLACTDGETSENPFPIDAGDDIDAVVNGDAALPPDAAPLDAETTD